jgi:hypothetical protein
MEDIQTYECQVCGNTDSGCTTDECLVTLNQNLE